MSWEENTIWWHVYPLGALGAPIREGDRTPTPRLRDLVGWLDYAVSLGVNGLLLGPIFQSSTHGYDTTDQFSIDPRLGTNEDFKHLVEEAHARGIKILLDGVFSHVGEDDPRLQDALREGPDSQWADLFDIDWQTPGDPTPSVFEGHGSLPRLNHASPAAIQYAADVMNYWLDLGADGWRLDAAYSVDSAFWRQSLAQVRQNHPDAWFLGEVIHGDYPQFIEDSTVDSVTQYMLWKAIWSSLVDENLFELDWALKNHNLVLDQFLPNTFIGNHDVTRIATQVGSEGALVALAVLATVGGIPSIYYGDEQGYRGDKEERIGGDDQVRPPLPASPDEFSALGERSLRAHQDLIGLRRRNPWLNHARTSPVTLENKHYVYKTQAPDRSESLTVELTLEGTPQAIVRDSGGAVLWQS